MMNFNQVGRGNDRVTLWLQFTKLNEERRNQEQNPVSKQACTWAKTVSKHSNSLQSSKYHSWTNMRSPDTRLMINVLKLKIKYAIIIYALTTNVFANTTCMLIIYTMYMLNIKPVLELINVAKSNILLKKNFKKNMQGKACLWNN